MSIYLYILSLLMERGVGFITRPLCTHTPVSTFLPSLSVSKTMKCQGESDRRPPWAEASTSPQLPSWNILNCLLGLLSWERC